MKVWCENPYDFVLFDEWEHVVSPEDADVLLFSGGSDVTPWMYGQAALSSTAYSVNRDEQNKSTFDMFPDKIKIGICRGSQFLNVMNGGTLYQDVTNHTSNHGIFTDDGKYVMVNSTHHQMMYDIGDGELLGWSEGLSDYYKTDNFLYTTPVLFEPEIVKWPNTKSIGFQYHPEWMNKEAHARVLFNEYVNKFVEEVQ